MNIKENQSLCVLTLLCSGNIEKYFENCPWFVRNCPWFMPNPREPGAILKCKLHLPAYFKAWQQYKHGTSVDFIGNHYQSAGERLYLDLFAIPVLLHLITLRNVLPQVAPCTISHQHSLLQHCPLLGSWTHQSPAGMFNRHVGMICSLKMFFKCLTPLVLHLFFISAQGSHAHLGCHGVNTNTEHRHREKKTGFTEWTENTTVMTVYKPPLASHYHWLYTIPYEVANSIYCVFIAGGISTRVRE